MSKRIKASITLAPDVMPMLKQMAEEKGIPYSFLLDILIRDAHAGAKTFVTTKTKKGKK